MMVRYVSQDWINERDPLLSIECLDPVPPKRRLTPEEIIARIRGMAMFPVHMDRLFFAQQNALKLSAGVNKFELQHLPGVEFPVLPGRRRSRFSPGEALIVETDLPKVRPYWNLPRSTTPTSTPPNSRASPPQQHQRCDHGKPSSDGKLRAVIALEDPGVPNWLDTAGFTEGTFWGRWYGCDSTPLPTLKRVPLAKVRDYLPRDTPHVTLQQRAEELRARVRACVSGGGGVVSRFRHANHADTLPSSPGLVPGDPK